MEYRPASRQLKAQKSLQTLGKPALCPDFERFGMHVGAQRVPWPLLVNQAVAAVSARSGGF